MFLEPKPENKTTALITTIIKIIKNDFILSYKNELKFEDKFLHFLHLNESCRVLESFGILSEEFPKEPVPELSYTCCYDNNNFCNESSLIPPRHNIAVFVEQFHASVYHIIRPFPPSTDVITDKTRAPIKTWRPVIKCPHPRARWRSRKLVPVNHRSYQPGGSERKY